MRLTFTLTFTQGTTVVATVVGTPRDVQAVTILDVTERRAEVEQYLEKLTGLRCHIQSDVPADLDIAAGKAAVRADFEALRAGDVD